MYVHTQLLFHFSYFFEAIGLHAVSNKVRINQINRTNRIYSVDQNLQCVE